MGKKSTTKKRGKNVDMHSFVFFSSDCSQNLNPMSRSENLKLRSSMQNKDRFPISGSDFWLTKKNSEDEQSEENFLRAGIN